MAWFSAAATLSAWGDVLAITYYAPSDKCWADAADGSKPCVPRKWEPGDGDNQLAPKLTAATITPTEYTYWWDYGGVPLSRSNIESYGAFQSTAENNLGDLERGQSSQGSGGYTTEDPLSTPCMCAKEGGQCKWFVPLAAQPTSTSAGDGLLYVEPGETGSALQFLPRWDETYGDQYASLGPIKLTEALELPAYSEGHPLLAVYNGAGAAQPDTFTMPESDEDKDGGCSIVLHDGLGGRGVTVGETFGDGWSCRDGSEQPCLWVFRGRTQWETNSGPSSQYVPPKATVEALEAEVMSRLRPHYEASRLPAYNAPFIGAQILMEGKCVNMEDAASDCEDPPCCVPFRPLGAQDQVAQILANWRQHPDHPANARARALDASLKDEV